MQAATLCAWLRSSSGHCLNSTALIHTCHCGRVDPGWSRSNTFLTGLSGPRAEQAMAHQACHGVLTCRHATPHHMLQMRHQELGIYRAAYTQETHVHSLSPSGPSGIRTSNITGMCHHAAFKRQQPTACMHISRLLSNLLWHIHQGVNISRVTHNNDANNEPNPDLTQVQAQHHSLPGDCADKPVPCLHAQACSPCTLMHESQPSTIRDCFTSTGALSEP
jgi:hypothetical protein